MMLVMGSVNSGVSGPQTGTLTTVVTLPKALGALISITTDPLGFFFRSSPAFKNNVIIVGSWLIPKGKLGEIDAEIFDAVVVLTVSCVPIGRPFPLMSPKNMLIDFDWSASIDTLSAGWFGSKPDDSR